MLRQLQPSGIESKGGEELDSVRLELFGAALAKWGQVRPSVGMQKRWVASEGVEYRKGHPDSLIGSRKTRALGRAASSLLVHDLLSEEFASYSYESAYQFNPFGGLRSTAHA
jgi:hypothetical protein